MNPTIYIETTIAGHLTTRLPKDPIVAGQMLATRRWWDESRDQFDLFTSDVVLAEAAQGDLVAAAERTRVLSPIPRVPLTDAGRELANDLVARHALPDKARVDAIHVAIAASNRLQFLLTWNCRHLANAVLRPRIEQACRDHGFPPPIICTPPELPEARP